MNIIIAGAGGVCNHLANLLAKENHDITIIDINKPILERIAKKLDVLTIQGNSTSTEVLEQSNIKKADLLIAVTKSEITNILTAILSKQFGAKTTVARISNIEHLRRDNFKRFKQLGIDVLISPQQLAALEISNLLQRSSFLDIYDFEGGKITIVGIEIGRASCRERVCMFV